MASKLTVDEFLAALESSGVVSREQLQQIRDSDACAETQAEQPSTLADSLVNDRTLTRWQADTLLKGNPSDVFLGKYKLLDLLGEGSMGTVYLAEHSMMRRRCALKVLPASQVGESSNLERFLREAQAVAALDHPNIVRAYDIYDESQDDQQLYYLAMEYVRGDDVQSLVSRDGPFDWIKAADVARQVADGLAHAHAANLVHRDVKPSNLLIDREGVVKILDLGLVSFFDENKQSSVTLDNSETILGTADYMSPEQALDSHGVDHRTDIYSLGCVLYFMLTGRPPFHEGPVAMRLMAHQSKQATPIRDIVPDVPPELAEVLHKMLEKDSDTRFATATEVSDALRPFGEVESETIPASSPAPTMPPKSRRRATTLLAVFSGLLVASLAIFFAVFGPDSNQSGSEEAAQNDNTIASTKSQTSPKTSSTSTAIRDADLD